MTSFYLYINQKWSSTMYIARHIRSFLQCKLTILSIGLTLLQQEKQYITGLLIDNNITNKIEKHHFCDTIYTYQHLHIYLHQHRRWLPCSVINFRPYSIDFEKIFNKLLETKAFPKEAQKLKDRETRSKKQPLLELMIFRNTFIVPEFMYINRTIVVYVEENMNRKIK